LEDNIVSYIIETKQKIILCLQFFLHIFLLFYTMISHYVAINEWQGFTSEDQMA